MKEKVGLQLPECVCSALRMVTRSITQSYDDALQPSGLRAMQFFVLMTIRGHGEAGVGELTAALKMDQTTVTRSLQTLEKNGWIEAVERSDRRRRAFRLSREGMAVLAVAEPLWEQAQQRSFAILGQADWEQARQALARLIQAQD